MVVVNAPDSCAPGPTAAAGPTDISTMMDGEGDDDGFPKSNGLHNANDVVPMRTRAVISHAAKSSLLAYFQRVNWPLNNVLPRGKAFFGRKIGNIVKEFGLSKGPGITAASELKERAVWISADGRHHSFI